VLLFLSFNSEETWRRTLIDLSSADLKEIPGVKKQRSKPENGKHLQLSKNDHESTEMIRVRRLFWKILIFHDKWRSIQNCTLIVSNIMENISYEGGRFICLLTVIYSWNLYWSSLLVHTLTFFFLSCFVTLHYPILIRLSRPLLRQILPLRFLY